MRIRLDAAALGLLLLATARPGGAATADVHLGGGFGLAFSPQTVNVTAGDTVRWINDGGLHSVTGDDGSFGTPPADSFTYSHTFPAAGSFGYHCLVHGFPGGGMFGTVVVGGGGSQPGTLRLSQASYSVSEGGGSFNVTVQRIDGDDGTVAVDFAAGPGTASAGSDFVATSGTLSWPSGDAASRTFPVTVLADAIDESNETVLLLLADPTGGATIDPGHQTATLTIFDDDLPPPGNPPAAPSDLVATAQSTTEVALSWTDHASDETGFLVERRRVDGSFEQVLTASANATAAVVPGLDPSTLYLFRVRAAGAAGASSSYSGEASATTLGNVAPCAAGAQTLCLNGGRFRTEVVWRTANDNGHGQAVPVPSAPDSGLFYFFSPSNLEMLIKVLDACAFDRYWVFYAATTNVELAVVVTDTQSGQTRGYYNPLDRAAPPVQDTNAFDTCP